MPKATSPQSKILKLNYEFIPKPSPILVSVPGGNASVIDLTVIISSPAAETFTFNQIEITIPVGSDAAGFLSTMGALPKPVCNDAPVKVSVSGSTVYITPSTGDVFSIDLSAITFYLNSITICTIPGTVPISISEYPPDSMTRTDDHTFTLVKEPSNYAVTDFYAKPDEIYAVGESTTLYWTCNDNGEKYTYNLRSDNENFNAAFQNPYTVAEGSQGIVTPDVTKTTTVYLDTIATDSFGGNVIATDSLTVQLTLPTFVGNAYYDPTSPAGSGRLIRLHWKADNASHCEIAVNDVIYIHHAPVDTFAANQGYPLLINTTSNSIKITIYACSAESDAKANVDLFPLIRSPLKYPTPLPMGYPAGNWMSNYAITVSPDGRCAAYMGVNLTNGDPPTSYAEVFLVVISIPDFICTLPPYGSAYYSRGTSNIVITSDSNYAYVFIDHYRPPPSAIHLGEEKRSLSFYGTLYKMAVNPIKISDDSIFIWKSGMRGLSLSADNQWLLSTDCKLNSELYYRNTALFTNFIHRPMDPAEPHATAPGILKALQVGDQPMSTAITSDGTKALIVNYASNSVSVLDLASFTAIKTLSVGTAPLFVAITKNDEVALVANSGSNNVSVINMKTLEVETAIPVGIGPCNIAITHDGILAIVSNKGSGDLTSIDIPNRTTVPETLSIGSAPVAIAITPDQNLILVGQEVEQILTVI